VPKAEITMNEERIKNLSGCIYETIQLIVDYCCYNENFEKISPIIPVMKQLQSFADELNFLINGSENLIS